MRTGIDFVPLDVTLDDKFALLEAEYGIKAFAVVVKLFQKIYGLHGYYCEWTKDVALLFARNNGLTNGVVSEIVEAAVRRGIFDRGMYERYHILTSHGIQVRYIKATVRKVRVELKAQYLLISHTEFTQNVAIKSENVTDTFGNGADTPVNKVKQNKDNLNKDNETCADVVVPENIIDAYEKNIGKLTPAVKKEIAVSLEDTDVESIIWAIEETARQNKKSWKYTAGILRNMRNKGVMTADTTDFEEIERIIMEKM